jgi:hypothetical protein
MEKNKRGRIKEKSGEGESSVAGGLHRLAGRQTARGSTPETSSTTPNTAEEIDAFYLTLMRRYLVLADAIACYELLCDSGIIQTTSYA